MRLINTNTLLFEEFIGTDIPKFALLFHTWESDEVTFQDTARNPSFRQKKG
jgi:hypothetical protein